MSKKSLGIIINYPFAERAKNELIPIVPSSPNFFKKIPKKYIKRSTGTKKLGVPYDIAIGYYIKAMYPDITVGFIHPHELSISNTRKYDLVFTIIYDLLEALNLKDNGSSIKEGKPNNETAMRRLRNIIKYSGNVYPNLKYQEFFNSKCTYYKYLRKKHISVSPTVCITIKSKTHFLDKIFKNLKMLNIQQVFFTKPDGGQEAICARKWEKGTKKDNVESRGGGTYYFKDKVELRNKMGAYYQTCAIKFPRIILQKYIPGLEERDDEDDYDKESPENRTFFVGGKYQYTVTTDNYCHRQPRADNGPKYFIDCEQWNLNKTTRPYIDGCNIGDYRRACRGPQVSKKMLARTKALGERVMKVLPSIKVNSIKLPPLLNRVDIAIVGKKYNKNQPIYVNEIEFVPSLYHRDVRFGKKKHIYMQMGDQMAKILGIYKSKKPRKLRAVVKKKKRTPIEDIPTKPRPQKPYEPSLFQKVFNLY